MHSHVHALLTNRRCVLISIPCIEIALIDSLSTRLTDHALKIIDFLVLVRHFFALQAAQQQGDDNLAYVNEKGKILLADDKDESVSGAA